MKMGLDKAIIFESMQEILNLVNPRHFSDILYDSRSISHIKKTISGDVITYPHERGFVFRVFNGIKFYELADSNIHTLLSSVKQLLQKISFTSDFALQEHPITSIDKEFPQKLDIRTVPLQDKVDYINEIYSQVSNTDSRVLNTIIHYEDSITKRLYLNSRGAKLRQVIPRIHLLIQPLIKIKNKIHHDSRSFSAQAGIEFMDTITPEIIHEIVHSSIEFAKAKLSPIGLHNLILDPSIAGLIAHEGVGHAAEADQIIRDRSFLKPYFQKKITSDIVNISDSPNLPCQVGSYLFDDEGIEAKKTHIVREGIFESLIHNRITATKLDLEPKGNGRRETFLHPLYPRMSNTYFEQGDYSLEEMMSEIKNGVLLTHGYFGKEDIVEGNLQCSSAKGYLIENGEKTQIIRGTTLTGNIIQFLNSISGISNSNPQFDSGLCGKGFEDNVPITTGGVFLMAKNVKINQN